MSSLDLRAEKAARRINRYALSRAPSPDYGDAFGVDDSRIRHYRTDDPDGPLERTVHAVMVGDEEVARALRDAVDAAWEHRAVLSADPSTLISRWHFLWHREHERDAEEDKQAALYLGGSDGAAYDDALILHASDQAEMAEIRSELEARGVDPRAVLREGYTLRDGEDGP